MSISIASRKSKGRNLQKWICEQISNLTGFEWGKDKPIESRPMGQSGCDVRLEKQVLDVFKFSIEAKNQEKWAIPQWIDQAKENQMENTDWLLFVKRNRYDPIVILDAKAFFKILKQMKKKELRIKKE